MHGLEDIRRGAEAGLRSMLITDLGVLELAAQMRAEGVLPADLRFKISVQTGLSNPASVRLAERLGADTYNVPTDLTLPQLAAIRAATDLPLDVYIEAPDDMGGFVRHYEIAEIVRVAAPVYVKFGLRNAQAIYPSGHHLEAVACANAIEKVHRAAVALEWLERLSPGLVQSKPGAAGLGVPVR